MNCAGCTDGGAILCSPVTQRSKVVQCNGSRLRWMSSNILYDSGAEWVRRRCKCVEEGDRPWWRAVCSKTSCYSLKGLQVLTHCGSNLVDEEVYPGSRVQHSLLYGLHNHRHVEGFIFYVAHIIVTSRLIRDVVVIQRVNFTYTIWFCHITPAFLTFFS